MAVPKIRTNDLLGTATPPSALKSPRGGTPKSGVRFGADFDAALAAPIAHVDPFAAPAMAPPPEKTSPSPPHSGGLSPLSGSRRSGAGGGLSPNDSIARKQRGMALSPPQGPPGMGPLAHVAPTPATIAARLTVLHGMVVASDDLAPLVKKKAHKLLLAIDRALVPTTRTLTDADEKRKAKEAAREAEKKKKEVGALKGRATAESTADRLARKKREEEDAKRRQERLLNVKVGRRPSVGSAGGGGGVKLSASALRKASAAAAGDTAAPVATPPPSGDGAGTKNDGEESASGMSSLSNLSARNRKKLRQAACERSWKRLAKMAQKDLSGEELKLLSLSTIRKLMNHYGIDHDPVEVANIELQWRVHAQAREDDRHKNSIMHKACEAADDKTKTTAARNLSKTFDKASPKRA